MSVANGATAQWRVTRAINDASFALLVFVVLIAPIPWGGVLPGGQLMIEGLAFTIAALAFVTRPAGRPIGIATVPLLSLCAIAALGAVQLLPMPVATLRQLSPLSASVYETANGILKLFGRAPLQPRISIAPWETASTALLTLAYAALFTSAAILCTTRLRRRIFLGALFATSVIHVVYAAVAPPGRHEGELVSRVHGAFVNPNHFAGYLEIALAFAFATIWLETISGRDRTQGIREAGERLEKRLVPMVLRILLWGVIAAGIALSRSRGGILAALLTTIAMIVLASIRRRSQRFTFAIAVTLAVAAGLVFVAVTTGNAPLLRFMASDPRDIRTDTRMEIWTASLDAWRTSPLLGDGLGAFRESFRRVQPREVIGLVEQAHDDFLQMLVTGGVVGAALIVIAFSSIFALLMRAWLRQPHREERAIALGGLGALLSLVLHGIVEFNMSIPAIPATLAAVLGLAWAAARYDL